MERKSREGLQARFEVMNTTKSLREGVDGKASDSTVSHALLVCRTVTAAEGRRGQGSSTSRGTSVPMRSLFSLNKNLFASLLAF